VKKGWLNMGLAPRREIKEFFITVTLQQFGTSAINIFEPIYLYELGISSMGIVLFFLGTYLPYIFILPFGGKFAKRFGYEHTMLVGTLFNVAYYLALAAIPLSPIFLFIAPPLFALQKTFWWPAYHANFARFSKQREVGREIGVSQIINSLTSAIGPLLGGLALAFSGFTTLYIGVSVLLILSVVPLFTTPEKFVPTKISWGEQMRFVFRKAYRRRLLGALGFGEEVIAMTLWPVFMFLVVGSALNLGIVVTIATGVTVVVTWIASRMSDRAQDEPVSLAASLVNLVSWIVRPFIMSFGGILAVDTAARASKNAFFVPAYSRVYADARANHVMIEVVAFEIALVLGKILALVAMLIVLQFTDSLPIVFTLGAGFSLLYFIFR
jgi:MFS family permease